MSGGRIILSCEVVAMGRFQYYITATWHVLQAQTPSVESATLFWLGLRENVQIFSMWEIVSKFDTRPIYWFSI